MHLLLTTCSEKRAGLLIAALLAVSGCASTSEFERIQADWLGKPIDDYLAESGLSPTGVLSGPDGHVYIFSFSREYRTPFRTTEESPTIDKVESFPTNPYPGAGASIPQACTWMYRVDGAGVITGFEYEGNACVQ